MTPSLAGRTLLLTRPAEGAAQWQHRLEALGARTLLLPCLVCEPVTGERAARRLREALGDAGWLALQSPRGAMSAAALLGGAVPRAVRIAAVGPATAHAAGAAFGRVDLTAVPMTSEGLGRAVAACSTPGTRVVIAAAEGGRDDAERALEGRGLLVTRVDVYRTVPAPPEQPRREFHEVDTVLLASPSAVTGFLNRAVPPRGARIVTIGPTTSAAARDAGLTVAAEARQPDFEGLLEVLA